MQNLLNIFSSISFVKNNSNGIRYFINFTSLLNNNKDVKVMKVLNVAEKNDAAKNIAHIISRGGSRWVSLRIFIYLLIFYKMDNCLYHKFISTYYSF